MRLQPSWFKSQQQWLLELLYSWRMRIVIPQRHVHTNVGVGVGGWGWGWASPPSSFPPPPPPHHPEINLYFFVYTSMGEFLHASLLLMQDSGPSQMGGWGRAKGGGEGQRGCAAAAIPTLLAK